MNLRPIVESERAHFADVRAKVAMNSRALDAH